MRSNEFRQLMARYPTGVAVLTVHTGTADHGMTLNSLVSISLHPPSILVSLGRYTTSLPLVLAAGVFGINVLAVGQELWARRFSAKPLPPDPFGDIATTRAPGGTLLFTEALACFEAEVIKTVEIDDHTVVVARVMDGNWSAGGEALVFHDSRFKTTIR